MVDRRSAVLRCWHAVEMFSPQSLPKATDKDVDDVTAGPLPWETPRRPTAPGMVHRYSLYLGVVPVRDLVDVLDQWGRGGVDVQEQRRSDDTALAACEVTEDGRLVTGSFVLSTCGWAVGRCRSRRPTAENLAGFEEAERDAFGVLTEMLDNSGPDPRLARETVDQLVAYLRSALGVFDLTDRGGVRVKRMQVPARAAAESELDFLNSFLLDDLRRVERHVASGGDVGAALGRYLAEPAGPARHDVRQDRHLLTTGTRPATMPMGRWPTGVTQNLVTNQQFAVNQIVGHLGDRSGLVAVNGPPGTGKTTLLRDLIAEIVVRRARALSRLVDPRHAFVGRSPYVNERTRGSIHHWHPDLVGHEIVVASSNNGALENVVNEIPSAAAVAPEWLDGADYFADIATDVLTAALAQDGDRRGGARRRDTEPVRAWALLAARLGNQRNRQRFVDSFWFKPNDDDESGSRRARGLLELLGTLARQHGEGSWEQAVDRFREAEQAAHARREEKKPAGEALCALPAAQRRRADARSALETAAHAQSTHERALADSEREVRRAQQWLDAAVAALDAHEERRPPFWRRFGRRWTGWKRARQTLLDDRVERAAVLARATDGSREREEAYERAADERRGAEDRYRAAAAEHNRLEAMVNSARRAWGDAVPGPEGPGPTASPWADEEWSAARTQLFLAALRLHRDFLGFAAHEMRSNLSLAIDVVKGSATSTLSPGLALEAWRTLFFVVPVVSTTFSSFGRLFSHLGSEALGWLFVDEAGQAVPQAAVGGLWRSRRAILVGDPLQLEPIEPLGARGRESLRAAYGAPHESTDGPRSVQHFGDRRAEIGTQIGPTWVGTPLVVHRRCDDPMFSISNSVAYDDMMVDGVGRRGDAVFDDDAPLPLSQWIDVPPGESDGHWRPAEGVELEHWLAGFRRHGFTMGRVMLLAPFLDVSRQLGQIGSRAGCGPSGTIHTAQGKEADVVFLVLGSDPDKLGARRWAAEKPNLVNVAVSRARRRLYVVGERRAWAELPYFSTLAARLPTRSVG